MSDTNTLIDDLLELYIQSSSERDSLRCELNRQNSISIIRIIIWIRDIINVLKDKFTTLLHNHPDVRYDESEKFVFLSENRERENPVSEDIYVHVHVFYLEFLHEIIDYLNNIPFDYDCYITTDSEQKRRIIENYFEGFLQAKNIHYTTTPNRGRDIGPWLVECKKINNKYQLACHIHTKKSILFLERGIRWRRYLMDNLLGSPDHVKSIISLFEEDQHLGLVFPPFYSEVTIGKKWRGNKSSVVKLLKRCDIEMRLPQTPDFSAGTMLWYRTEALAPLFNTEMEYSDFEDEKGQLEGTLMHAVERALVYVAQSRGYTIKKILAESELEKKIVY